MLALAPLGHSSLTTTCGDDAPLPAPAAFGSPVGKGPASPKDAPSPCTFSCTADAGAGAGAASAATPSLPRHRASPAAPAASPGKAVWAAGLLLAVAATSAAVVALRKWRL